MFSSLDASAQSFLIDNIVIQKYEKDEVVFRQGDPSDTYMVLLKGVAKLEFSRARCRRSSCRERLVECRGLENSVSSLENHVP